MLTVFPEGFDGQQTSQVVEVRSMGIFLFVGDAMHTEKLYADVTPLKGVYSGGGSQSLGVVVEVTRVQ